MCPKDPAQHWDHVPHWGLIQGRCRVSAQPQATHKIISTDAQRKDSIPQLCAKRATQLAHRPRVVYVAGFKRGHQQQVGVGNCSDPLAQCGKGQFRHYEPMRCGDFWPLIEYSRHPRITRSNENQWTSWRAINSRPDSSQDRAQRLQSMLNIGRGNRVL
ncbi:Hypothetical protein (plasmid) [Pseudomonas putida]|nr:Hypothetical protein [Pseudomonas putida]